jgi:hypothetical protein
VITIRVPQRFKTRFLQSLREEFTAEFTTRVFAEFLSPGAVTPRTERGVTPHTQRVTPRTEQARVTPHTERALAGARSGPEPLFAARARVRTGQGRAVPPRYPHIPAPLGSTGSCCLPETQLIRAGLAPRNAQISQQPWDSVWACGRASFTLSLLGVASFRTATSSIRAAIFLSNR